MGYDLQSDEELRARLNELAGAWHRLGRGDMSCVCHVVTMPDSQQMTMGGSPHARFWAGLEDIGWAEQTVPQLGEVELPFKLLTFRLTTKGYVLLPRFLLDWRLVGPLTLRTDTPEPAPTPPTQRPQTGPRWQRLLEPGVNAAFAVMGVLLLLVGQRLAGLAAFLYTFVAFMVARAASAGSPLPLYARVAFACGNFAFGCFLIAKNLR